jgi:hypothetical protein
VSGTPEGILDMGLLAAKGLQFATVARGGGFGGTGTRMVALRHDGRRASGDDQLTSPLTL